MEPDYALQRTISRVQSALSDKLAEFLYSDVYYSVRRVMAAELKHAYVGPTVGKWTTKCKAKRCISRTKTVQRMDYDNYMYMKEISVHVTFEGIKQFMIFVDVQSVWK